MKKSKYLNKSFDHGWTCTHVGVACVTGAYRKGTKTRNSRPHHQTYYYIFERKTSDRKAEKLIRLNSSEAAKVWRKQIEVEDIVSARQSQHEGKFTKKVSYHFIDRK